MSKNNMADNDKSEPQENNPQQNGSSHNFKSAPSEHAITSNKALAILAMEGADPWQRIVVYACFGIILGSILIIGLPPYTTAKQVSVFVILALALLVSILFIFKQYSYLRGDITTLTGEHHSSSVHAAEKLVAQSLVGVTSGSTEDDAKKLVVNARSLQRSFGIGWILASSVSFIIAFYIVSRFMGYDPLWKPFPNWHQSLQSGALARAVSVGVSNKRNFIFESVTMFVRLDDNTHNGVRQRKSVVRTIYTLRALKDLSKDKAVFKEEYSTDTGKEVIYWQGSAKQRIQSGAKTSKSYDVLFDAPKGENYTLVTGATIIGDLPFPNRTDHGVSLLPDQDAWFYPNEQDTTGEVTIVIESASVNLRLTDTPAIRRKSDGSIVESEATLYPKGDHSAETTTLVAHWSDVLPGEVVGLQYAW